MEYLVELLEALNKAEITCDAGEKAYKDGVGELVSFFLKCREDKATVFFVGNGGSSAIACHMTADFLKNGKMHTCGLYDNAVVTCLGNDYGYEYVFCKQLEALMTEKDVLVAISSSGNSQNIINSIEVAHEKKGKVVTFTGFKSNNRARSMGDINIYVPCEKYGIVESIHNLILQQIVDEMMEKLK